MTNEELVAKAEQALALSGQMNFADAVELARARKLQIFSQPECLVLTQVCDWPRARVLDYVAVAGTLRGVMAIQSTIEDFARSERCTALSACGRPSWGYVGERLGWRPRAMLFGKQLTPPGSH